MISSYFLILGALVLMHLLYDFHWQGDFVGVMKSKSDFILFIHCLTYTLCISAVLVYFGIFSLFKFAFLLITHWIVDRWKCRNAEKGTELTTSLYLDQFLHLLVLIAIITGA